MTTSANPTAPANRHDLKERLAAGLTASRRRSLDLTDPLDEPDLIRQHSPLMSPLVWDLAHVGNFEELWLLREVGGVDPLRPDINDLYDAFTHPRADRPSLPILPPAETRRYIATVRDRVLDVLEATTLDPTRPLLADGFVYGMIIQHEHQHDETMLATLQLRAGAPVLPEGSDLPPGRQLPSPESLVPAGPFVMGTDGVLDPWAYDNERPAHRVELPAYWIDTAPITNAAYAEFVEAGGYRNPRPWSQAGWAWRSKAGVVAPQFWRRDGAGWARERFGRVEPVPPDEPVQHVSWYEADAYARWAGKRLPTEAEWEKACGWDPVASRSRRYPWGDDPPTVESANLGQRASRPAPVGAYPAGRSAYGVEQLLGDVWEWTATDFGGYPGYLTFPYAEYSEVFFGPAYKVLRGGSWATDPSACRATFRNWDYPIRRQIFAGFRCARDAAPGKGG